MHSHLHLVRTLDELKRQGLLDGDLEPAELRIGRTMAQEIRSAAALYNGFDGGLRDSLLRDAINVPRRSLADLGYSLLDLRTQILREEELETALDYPSKVFSSAPSALSALRQAERLTSLGQLSGLTETFSERISASITQHDVARITELTRPFHRVRDEIMRNVNGMSNFADPAGWARRLGVHSIDAASAAAVAHLWGVQDTIRILRELPGVDLDALTQIASVFNTESYVDDDDGEEHESGLDQRPNDAALSLSDKISILSILLCLLLWHYSNKSSEAMEVRLTANYRALHEQRRQAEQRLERHIEHVSNLASSLIKHAQPTSGIQFAVRSRGAMIKTDKNRGVAVAEALPGQVVTLIAEEGKWIEISYFDFATQERQAGWALKKYFVRAKVDSTPREPKESRANVIRTGHVAPPAE